MGKHTDTLHLRDANVVPDASFNLLSLTKLLEEGAGFHLSLRQGNYLSYNGRDYPLISQRGLLLIDLSRPLEEVDAPDDFDGAYMSVEDDVYISSDSGSPAHVAAAAAAAPMKVWHERLGHASRARINHLNSSGAALGMNIRGKDTHDAKCSCEACLKTNNVSRGIGASRQFADTVSRKGEVITSDVLGPFPRSVEGHRFAISFTDEYSRHSMVYLLKKKSDAAAAVEALVRYYRSMNLVISEIRHDHGGEYMGTSGQPTDLGGSVYLPSPELNREIYSTAFKAACSRHRIKPVPMPAYTPQLHGVAERWNKTVMKMANSMMYRARISPILWSSAIVHANTIRNYLPTRSRGGFTPHELFTNHRPRYENFRIWGCYCYKKLHNCRKIPGLPVRKRLIYVGESPDAIGFRCFDPVEYKFTTEFDLIFDEESVERRSALLEAYDNRRQVIGRGDNADEVPLVSNFDHSATMERAVFLPSSPSRRGEGNSANESIYVGRRSPPKSLDEPGGPGAGSPDDASIRPVVASAGSRRDGLPQSTSEAVAIKSSVTPTATSGSDDRLPSTTSINGTRSTDSEGVLPSHPSKTSTVDRQSSLGARGNNGSSSKSLEIGKRSDVRPELPLDLDDFSDYDPDEIEPQLDLRQYVESLDPGLLDSSKPLPRNTTPELKGSELDIQGDRSADQDGPLLKRNLEQEILLGEYSLTPGSLRCPIRNLPVGKPEPETPELNRFIKLAILENLPISVQQSNPKSGESAARYEKYKAATTIQDFFTVCKLNRFPKAKADFKNDFCRGFITFPRNTRQRQGGAHHIACAASHDDLHANLEASVHGPDIITDPLPPTYSSFHDLIASLWPRDPYLSDEELRSQATDALNNVTALLVESTVKYDTPEPTSYKKAVHKDNPEREYWIAAINKELATLTDRGTWSYIEKGSIPKSRRPIRCKFVFKRKYVKDGTIQYKARLVACGVTQRAGLDYSTDELYASVCSYSSMRFLMSLATQKSMLLYQTDIQGAYLESYLDDEIYMYPPEGLEGHSNHFCRLLRGLYGCKQSGWAWSQCFKEFMTSDPKYDMNFAPMTGEPNLYRRAFVLNGKREEVFVGQYVDDCLVAASSQEALNWFNDKLKQRFPVNPKSSGYITSEDPGLLLSMQVKYDIEKGILQFNQERAIRALAEKYKLDDPHQARTLPIAVKDELPKLTEPSDPSFPSTFLSIIGSCLHICQVSRPDCSYAVGVLARHAATPGDDHMTAAYDLVRYMYSTRHWCIQYVRSASSCANSPQIHERSHHVTDPESGEWREDLSELYKLLPPPRTIEQRLETDYVPLSYPNHPNTYIDANLGGDKVTRKSTSGMVVMMNGGPIAWASRLQKLCAQSSAEAEIIAVVDTVKEALHIKLLCEESGIRPPNIPMEIQEDNNACIHMAHNLRGSQQAKHYELRLRFLNEHVLEKNIEFSRVDTTKQLADGFTKPLSLGNFRIFRNWMLHNPKQPVKKA